MRPHEAARPRAAPPRRAPGAQRALRAEAASARGPPTAWRARPAPAGPRGVPPGRSTRESGAREDPRRRAEAIPPGGGLGGPAGPDPGSARDARRRRATWRDGRHRGDRSCGAGDCATRRNRHAASRPCAARIGRQRLRPDARRDLAGRLRRPAAGLDDARGDRRRLHGRRSREERRVGEPIGGQRDAAHSERAACRAMRQRARR